MSYITDNDAEMQAIEAAHNAKKRRVSAIFYGSILTIVILVIAALSGGFSPSPDTTVRRFLDAYMTNGQWSQYDYAFNTGSNEVIGKVVRSYEIKNVIEDTVSVDITFESRAGTDLHKTLRFTVRDEKITLIE
jgi:hypothetical protein